MVGTLIDTATDGTWRRAARGTGLRGMLTAAHAAYREHAKENRRDKDIAAIAATLSRLSPRRLEMIGVRSDHLVRDVEKLMAQTVDARDEAQEILAIVDSSTAERTSKDATINTGPSMREARELVSPQAA